MHKTTDVKERIDDYLSHFPDVKLPTVYDIEENLQVYGFVCTRVTLKVGPYALLNLNTMPDKVVYCGPSVPTVDEAQSKYFDTGAAFEGGVKIIWESENSVLILPVTYQPVLDVLRTHVAITRENSVPLPDGEVEKLLGWEAERYRLHVNDL